MCLSFYRYDLCVLVRVVSVLIDIRDTFLSQCKRIGPSRILDDLYGECECMYDATTIPNDQRLANVEQMEGRGVAAR